MVEGSTVTLAGLPSGRSGSRWSVLGTGTQLVIVRVAVRLWLMHMSPKRTSSWSMDTASSITRAVTVMALASVRRGL